jgi:hypothetical protein
LIATTFSRQDLRPLWKEATQVPGLAAKAAIAPLLPAIRPPLSIERAKAGSFRSCRESKKDKE